MTSLEAAAAADVGEHRELLEAFEAWYDAIEEAIAARDADEVLKRVEARAQVLSALDEALAGRQLPAALEPLLAAREARVGAGLRQLSDSILAQLAEARQHEAARVRYARAEVAEAPSTEETI